MLPYVSYDKPQTNPLGKILAGLSNLNLEGTIVRKQPHASGLGGSCDVYSAWSTKYNKKVAVKQIRAYLTKDKSLAKKLAAEIRIWARLNHDFVLPLLGFIIEGKNMMPALISAWMERGTLYDAMKSFPRGGIDALNMLRDIASGLAYLHAQHVIHADLKSQNILISPTGDPLIADFGLSLAISQSQSTMGTTSASTKGTVRWMAIELLPSASLDGAAPVKPNEMTDIWSFGMVAYELLSWQVPYIDKINDVQVLMAIVNGELPTEPTPDEDGDPIIFKFLWDMCRSCWTTRNSRPRAHKLWSSLSIHAFALKIGFREGNAANRTLSGLRLEPQSASLKLKHAHYYNVHHIVPLDRGPREGHTCQAQITDDLIIFSCDPANLIGPICSVELRYVASPAIFEFCLDSGITDGYEAPKCFFSVASIEEAFAWVQTFEFTVGTTVQFSVVEPQPYISPPASLSLYTAAGGETLRVAIGRTLPPVDQPRSNLLRRAKVLSNEIREKAGNMFHKMAQRLHIYDYRQEA